MKFGKTFIGDQIAILLDTGIDLSGATLKIKYRKPDGSSGEWTATIGDSTNIMKYETRESDLDVKGLWRIQAYAEFGTQGCHGAFAYLYVETHL